MDGLDKGLMSIGGTSMVEHVLTRLEPQVGTVLINANRNLNDYENLGVTVVRDRQNDFQGPLAGIASTLGHINTPFLLTVPCDSPLLANDIAGRLYRVLESEGTDVAVAHDGKRLHPVFCLLRTELRTNLENYLQLGQRKFEQWLRQTNWVAADCGPIADSFLNINKPSEFAALKQQIENRNASQ